MKFVISGGAGFIGTALTERLAAQGHEVVVLDRHPPRLADPRVKFSTLDLLKESPPQEALEGAEAVIHLAGVTIFKRWTPSYKELIQDSRVKTAGRLIETIKQCRPRPKALISASAVGYYGDRGEEILTEESGPGEDFLARVCVEWEKAILPAQALGLRTASVRTGIVLGRGGMLEILVPLYQRFLGGRLGSGEQWLSWIQLADVISVYELVAAEAGLAGPVNAVSPQPVRNSEFTAALACLLHRPAIWRIPKFALKLALGEFGELTLGSQRVLPQKLLEHGFVFRFPQLEEALDFSLPPG